MTTFSTIEAIMNQPVSRELVVAERGAYIGKHSERIRVTRKGEVLAEMGLVDLRQILIISGGVSLSSDVVSLCAERGIPIHFLDFAGRSYAGLMSSQLTGTVKTRREQLLAYLDRRGLTLAKGFAEGKINNQLNLVRYMNKYQTTKNPTLHAEIERDVADMRGYLIELERVQGATVDEVRGLLLSVEGRAAQVYWEIMGRLLLVETDWPGRVTQGATDLVNSLLNFGYAILYSRVEQAIVLAGLDPFAGFSHTDRPGKPSLVYDLVEEFRQPVVDRVVFAMLNQRRALAVDADGRLTVEARKLLAAEILARLNDGRERYEGKKHTLQSILYNQARHIATFVRGDGQEYTPFITGW